MDAAKAWSLTLSPSLVTGIRFEREKMPQPYFAILPE
jgi:hypothetical protein